MVDPGDTVTNTLKKEFGEEALNSMELSQEENKRLHESLEDLFHHGTSVTKNYAYFTCIYVVLKKLPYLALPGKSN